MAWRWCLLLLVGCENIKHKIGISTKPFQSGEDLEDNTKINYNRFWQGEASGGRLTMILTYRLLIIAAISYLYYIHYTGCN